MMLVELKEKWKKNRKYKRKRMIKKRKIRMRQNKSRKKRRDEGNKRNGTDERKNSMEGIVGHSQVSETKLEKWEPLQHQKEDEKKKNVYHIVKRERK